MHPYTEPLPASPEPSSTVLAEVEEARFDALEECGSPTVTHDGFLVLEGIAAAPGELTYRRADGSTVVEYVSARTLEAAAPQVARLPVTLRHPSPVPVVTPENYASVVRGDTVDASSLPDGRTKVRIVVRDAETIKAIKAPNGPRMLSLGYMATVRPLTGGAGGQYEQVSRRYNHIAIVEQGRAAGAHLRADAADAELVQHRGVVPPHQEQKMDLKKVKFPDGAELELEASAAALVEAQIARADSAQADVERLYGEVAAVTKQLDAVRADAADDKVSARVKSALDVIQFAQANHVPVTDAKGEVLSVDDIKRSVVAKSYRADSVDDELRAATGDRLDGMYAAAKRLLVANPPRHSAYDALRAAEGANGARRADSVNVPGPNVPAVVTLEALRQREAQIAAGANLASSTPN